MKSAADRLRWARETAGYKTQSDFCRQHDLNRGTYGGYESGSRGIPPPTAIKLSRLLRIDPGWLLTGHGIPRPGVDVSPTTRSVRWAPVISWIQAGQLGSADLIADSDTYVPILTEADNPVALEVRGTSMNRVAPPRSFIVVDPAQRHPEDGWAVIALIGDEVTFKRYRDTNGPIRLEPDSTDPHETLYPANGFEILGRVIEVITRL